VTYLQFAVTCRRASGLTDCEVELGELRVTSQSGRTTPVAIGGDTDIDRDLAADVLVDETLGYSEGHVIVEIGSSRLNRRRAWCEL
jgi:hypothetical protein